VREHELDLIARDDAGVMSAPDVVGKCLHDGDVGDPTSSQARTRSDFGVSSRHAGGI
jgi:hypothetical protein